MPQIPKSKQSKQSSQKMPLSERAVFVQAVKTEYQDSKAQTPTDVANAEVQRLSRNTMGEAPPQVQVNVKAPSQMSFQNSLGETLGTETTRQTVPVSVSSESPYPEATAAHEAAHVYHYQDPTFYQDFATVTGTHRDGMNVGDYMDEFLTMYPASPPWIAKARFATELSEATKKAGYQPNDFMKDFQQTPTQMGKEGELAVGIGLETLSRVNK